MLPSKVIASGGYLIIHPNWGPAFNETLPVIENNEVMYLKDTASNKYPVWYSDANGFLELLKNNVTVDFMTFGADYTATMPSAWAGGNVPSFGSDKWKSIARYKEDIDTNTSADWYVRDFSTYGGDNDVNSDGATSTLSDYNDWSVVNIIFAREYSGYSGISNNPTLSTIAENPTAWDIQTVAKETAIPRPIR